MGPNRLLHMTFWVPVILGIYLLCCPTKPTKNCTSLCTLRSSHYYHCAFILIIKSDDHTILLVTPLQRKKILSTCLSGDPTVLSSYKRFPILKKPPASNPCHQIAFMSFFDWQNCNCPGHSRLPLITIFRFRQFIKTNYKFHLYCFHPALSIGRLIQQVVRNSRYSYCSRIWCNTYYQLK